MSLPPNEWLRVVRRHLSVALGRFGDGWQDDGDLVVGPGVLAVRAAVTHGSEAGHVNIGFVMNRERSDSPVLWDCVAGASQDDAGAEFACTIWAQTTAPVALELGGYGRDDASALQRWCLRHPIVPILRSVLARALGPGSLHGVKFLLGAFDDESIAEVRIDGVRHDACSERLLEMDWPKEGKRVVRFFVVFLPNAP